MSRVAKNPVTVPAGVEVKFGTDALVIKGKTVSCLFLCIPMLLLN